MKPTAALRSFLLGSSVLATAISLHAATYYWDDNAAGTGFGTAGASTGTWAGPTAGPVAGWSTSSTGANAFAGFTTVASAANDTVNFGTDTASYGLAAGTITVAGTVAANKITFGSQSGAIVLSGGTEITMGGTTPTITVNNAQDTISTTIAQAGTTTNTGLTKLGSGELILSGAGNSIAGEATAAANGVGIRLGAGTLTVSGGSLTTATAGKGLGTFSGDAGNFKQTGGTVTVNATGDLIVGWNSNSTFTLSGGTTSAANIRHSDSGDGVVTISGTNTTTVGTTAGTVYHTSAGNGTDSLTVNLNTGGTLVTSRMYVNATGSGGSHALNINLNGGTLKASATANLIDNPTGTNSANASVNATVQAGGAVFDTNSFTATIQRGLLHDSALGLTPDGGLTLNDTAVTKGSLILNVANTYTGATTVNGGTLVLNHLSAIANSASVSVASGTTLQAKATGTYANTAAVTLNGSGTNTAGSTFAGALHFNASGSFVWNAPLTLGGAATTRVTSFGNGADMTLGAAIGGTGPLELSSRGGGSTTQLATWTLGVASNYTGATAIVNNDGLKDITVKLGVTNALPTTTSLNLSAITGSATAVYATLDLNGWDQQLAGLTDTGGSAVTSGTSNKRVINSSGTLATLTVNNAGDVTYGTTGTRITTGTIGGTTAAGVAANNLALIKNNVGILTLSGTNTYTGGTTVSAGTLIMGSASALGSTSGQLTVDGGALDMAANSLTIGNLTGTGGVISGTSGTRLLTIGQGNGTGGNYQGQINTGAGGTTALTKTGTGTITLSGTNGYSGATIVSGGKLTIASTGTINSTSGVTIGTASTAATTEFNYNSSTALTKSVSFATGSTGGTLSGSNSTINPAVNVTTGNTLAIGNSDVGVMNFASNLTIAGTYLFELNNTDNTADLGDVAGTLTLGGILDLVQLGAYTAGDKFTLLAYDGALSGLFKDSGGITNIGDDTNFTDAGGIWTMNYNDTTAGLNGGVSASNTYVTITAIPEPRAALLGGLGMLCLLRRRRN